MFGSDRDTLRRYYAESWRKARNSEPLQPLEQQLAILISEHPEYHPLLEADDDQLRQDFLPEQGESNPFLHMGMHLALREQVTTNRPAGINLLWQTLLKRIGDSHEAEHRMMECLGRILWEAQRSGRMPDEPAYLDCLRRLK